MYIFCLPYDLTMWSFVGSAWTGIMVEEQVPEEEHPGPQREAQVPARPEGHSHQVSTYALQTKDHRETQMSKVKSTNQKSCRFRIWYTVGSGPGTTGSESGLLWVQDPVLFVQDPVMRVQVLVLQVQDPVYCGFRIRYCRFRIWYPVGSGPGTVGSGSGILWVQDSVLWVQDLVQNVL